MKKHLKRSAMALVVIGIFLGSVALAQITDLTESSRFGQNSSGGFSKHPPRHAGHLLSKALHDNVLLEVLTEDFRLEAETVKAAMENRQIRQLLETNEIDREDFRSAMDAKFQELVDQAASCGLITEEQASEIGEAMQNRIQRQAGPAADGEER